MIDRYAGEGRVDEYIFSKRIGVREYVCIKGRWIDKIYGNPVSINENHLSCRDRI